MSAKDKGLKPGANASGSPAKSKMQVQLSPKQACSLALFAIEVIQSRAAADPSLWDKLHTDLEKYKKKHAKEIDARYAESHAAEMKATFERKAEYGTRFDEAVVHYLKACAAERIRMPDIDAAPENWLIWAFHWSVVNNFPNDLRKIADAVGRVHKRVEGEGANFKVKPAKPILASVAAIPAGGTLPTKIRELIAVAKDSGAKENVDGNVPGFSERNTRRIRDKLRLEPAPRGRPRKKRK
jgi:hypothetical protein